MIGGNGRWRNPAMAILQWRWCRIDVGLGSGVDRGYSGEGSGIRFLTSYLLPTMHTNGERVRLLRQYM
ncbi:hypothetical protein Tco_0905334 [Tanacetum coccineum]